MARPNFRETSVISSDRITPNMQRVRLGGAALNGFPDQSDGAYIKLMFDPKDGHALTEAEIPSLQARPLMRTYTVQHFDAAKQTLDVDFVIHGEGHSAGPASNWAVSCQPGDTLLIGGPGPAKYISQKADWFMLAGDMTALPALSANLAQLPSSAKGVAFIEINDEQDKQTLNKPDGIDVTWITKPKSLVDAVKQQPWPEGEVSVWAAAEFSTMRALRSYFKNDRAITRDNLYVSSYWKQGNTEDQHKVAKREDAEKNPE